MGRPPGGIRPHALEGLLDAFRTFLFDPPAQMRWLFEMIGEFLGGAQLRFNVKATP
jgi:hypothetical protein